MTVWWMWILLGALLCVIELLTPGGFFVIFFGVAAILVGLLDLAGVISTPWVEWLVFSIVALISLRVFRTPLLLWLREHEHTGAVDSLVGEVAIATTTLAPGDHGRVELRGSTWTGHNVGARTIAAAQRCRVVAVDGLRLDVDLA